MISFSIFLAKNWSLHFHSQKLEAQYFYEKDDVVWWSQKVEAQYFYKKDDVVWWWIVSSTGVCKHTTAECPEFSSSNVYCVIQGTLQDSVDTEEWCRFSYTVLLYVYNTLVPTDTAVRTGRSQDPMDAPENSSSRSGGAVIYFTKNVSSIIYENDGVIKFWKRFYYYSWILMYSFSVRCGHQQKYSQL